MIGRTLAHYRITAVIGAGGMGEVYRATDTRLGRDVALKMLPAEMATSPERLDRFRREAKALAALDHPGIVTIHSVEEADGVHFLTMQLVEGEPLDRLIPEGGMPIERLVTIATALADALAAAHGKGIVHRDLKPANLMVGEGGSVKVLDFGLAKVSTFGRAPGLGAVDRSADAGGRRDGDRALHVPRAGLGAARGPPDGRLLPRDRALRDGERATPVRRRIHGGARVGDPAGHPSSPHRLSAPACPRS